MNAKEQILNIIDSVGRKSEDEYRDLLDWLGSEVECRLDALAEDDNSDD